MSEIGQRQRKSKSGNEIGKVATKSDKWQRNRKNGNEIEKMATKSEKRQRNHKNQQIKSLNPRKIH